MLMIMEIQELNIHHLPNELLVECFTYLNSSQGEVASRVCRLWREIWQTPHLHCRFFSQQLPSVLIQFNPEFWCRIRVVCEKNREKIFKNLRKNKPEIIIAGTLSFQHRSKKHSRDGQLIAHTPLHSRSKPIFYYTSSGMRRAQLMIKGQLFVHQLKSKELIAKTEQLDVVGIPSLGSCLVHNHTFLYGSYGNEALVWDESGAQKWRLANQQSTIQAMHACQIGNRGFCAIAYRGLNSLKLHDLLSGENVGSYSTEEVHPEQVHIQGSPTGSHIRILLGSGSMLSWGELAVSSQSPHLKLNTLSSVTWYRFSPVKDAIEYQDLTGKLFWKGFDGSDSVFYGQLPVFSNPIFLKQENVEYICGNQHSYLQVASIHSETTGTQITTWLKPAPATIYSVQWIEGSSPPGLCMHAGYSLYTWGNVTRLKTQRRILSPKKQISSSRFRHAAIFNHLGISWLSVEYLDRVDLIKFIGS